MTWALFFLRLKNNTCVSERFCAMNLIKQENALLPDRPRAKKHVREKSLSSTYAIGNVEAFISASFTLNCSGLRKQITLKQL